MANIIPNVRHGWSAANLNMMTDTDREREALDKLDGLLSKAQQAERVLVLIGNAIDARRHAVAAACRADAPHSLDVSDYRALRDLCDHINVLVKSEHDWATRSRFALHRRHDSFKPALNLSDALHLLAVVEDKYMPKPDITFYGNNTGDGNEDPLLFEIAGEWHHADTLALAVSQYAINYRLQIVYAKQIKAAGDKLQQIRNEWAAEQRANAANDDFDGDDFDDDDDAPVVADPDDAPLTKAELAQLSTVAEMPVHPKTVRSILALLQQNADQPRRKYGGAPKQLVPKRGTPKKRRVRAAKVSQQVGNKSAWQEGIIAYAPELNWVLKRTESGGAYSDSRINALLREHREDFDFKLNRIKHAMEKILKFEKGRGRGGVVVLKRNKALPVGARRLIREAMTRAKLRNASK